MDSSYEKLSKENLEMCREINQLLKNIQDLKTKNNAIFNEKTAEIMESNNLDFDGVPTIEQLNQSIDEDLLKLEIKKKEFKDYDEINQLKEKVNETAEKCAALKERKKELQMELAKLEDEYKKMSDIFYIKKNDAGFYLASKFLTNLLISQLIPVFICQQWSSTSRASSLTFTPTKRMWRARRRSSGRIFRRITEYDD